MSKNVEAALERFEAMIAERDAKIEDLEAKIEAQTLAENWAWCIHKDHKVDLSPTLPVPRLEIRIEPKISGDFDDTETWRAGVFLTYALVYRHLLGHLVIVPLGKTDRSGGSGRKPNVTVETLWHELPFRDGAHIRNEMKQLGLPGFLVCGTSAEPIPLG